MSEAITMIALVAVSIVAVAELVQLMKATDKIRKLEVDLMLERIRLEKCRRQNR